MGPVPRAYVRAPGRVAVPAFAPVGLNTATSAGEPGSVLGNSPAGCAGVVKVMLVEELNTTLSPNNAKPFLGNWPPTMTLAVDSKFDPVTVIVAPPLVVLVAGLMPVMLGGFVE